jgi:hypothetical protein
VLLDGVPPEIFRHIALLAPVDQPASVPLSSKLKMWVLDGGGEGLGGNGDGGGGDFRGLEHLHRIVQPSCLWPKIVR